MVELDMTGRQKSIFVGAWSSSHYLLTGPIRKPSDVGMTRGPGPKTSTMAQTRGSLLNHKVRIEKYVPKI